MSVFAAKVTEFLAHTIAHRTKTLIFMALAIACLAVLVAVISEVIWTRKCLICCRRNSTP